MNVGKTSFVERYVNRRWLPHHTPTFGGIIIINAIWCTELYLCIAEYHQRNIRWTESDVIRLHVR